MLRVTETAREELFAEPWAFRKAYKAAMEQFIREVGQRCRGGGVDHVLLRTSDDLGMALSHYLHSRQRQAATKRAAATAIGLTSIFGYASTVLSGWGLGALVQRYGWDAGFAGLIIAAVIGTLLFIVAWPAKADGYES